MKFFFPIMSDVWETMQSVCIFCTVCLLVIQRCYSRNLYSYNTSSLQDYYIFMIGLNGSLLFFYIYFRLPGNDIGEECLDVLKQFLESCSLRSLM